MRRRGDLESMLRNTLLYLSRSERANRLARSHGLRLGADRFVAGETLEDALQKVWELNEQGILATLDHLGEFVASEEEATAAAAEAIRSIQAIAGTGVQANLSVKLTQLGLELPGEVCIAHMRRIVGEAKRCGGFVRIDMEDYAHNEATLAIFEQLYEAYGGAHVGLVLQAYLRKTAEDMERLSRLAPNYRLVKGAYKEAAEVAYPDKQEVDDQFKRIIRLQLDQGHYAAVATHDEGILEYVRTYVHEQGISNQAFEFQMLYGIRPQLQQQLAAEGYKVRVYVPYGTEWYGYFMRRMAERPENLTFVLKSIFRR